MQVVSTCLLRDLSVYQVTFRSLRAHLPGAELHVITRKDDFARFRKVCGKDLVLWDEAEMLPGMTLGELRAMPFPFFPRGAGWYFQQFLKFSFSDVSNGDEHFLIWDADTVLLKPVDFFDTEGRPYYTRAAENHRPYFQTFEALFGVPANREFSFISQHQVINKRVLREMFAEIHTRFPEARSWCHAVMENLKGEGTNLFSEYETYGHYLKLRHPGTYSVRDLRWTRDGGGKLGLRPWGPVLRRLARDHDFAAFEASGGMARKLVRALRPGGRPS